MVATEGKHKPRAARRRLTGPLTAGRGAAPRAALGKWRAFPGVREGGAWSRGGHFTSFAQCLSLLHNFPMGLHSRQNMCSRGFPSPTYRFLHDWRSLLFTPRVYDWPWLLDNRRSGMGTRLPASSSPSFPIRGNPHDSHILNSLRADSPHLPLIQPI